MKTYIELWKAKAEWLNASKEERENYIAALGPVIQQLLDNGVTIVSWGVNDGDTHSKVPYDFFAVWTFPDATSAQQFEQMVVGAGWYNYFDQVNARGEATSPQDVLAKMIAL